MNTKLTSIYPIGDKQIRNGSHMPIDFSIKAWSWRNPLNLLPLGIVALLLVGMLILLAQ